LDISYRPTGISAGLIKYESNTSVSAPIVDYKLYAPHFTALYKSVPLPSYLQPMITFPLHNVKYKDVLTNFRYKSMCIIQESLVQTFDNISYTLPQIDSKCFTVVAKDCSHERLFTILTARDGDRVTTRIYLSTRFKIELIPSDDGLTVKVNGKQISLSKTEPYTHFFKYDNREFEVFSITFNGAYYTVDARNTYDLVFFTDGNGFATQVSRYYTGKLCGLCGDSNGVASNEFRGANGQVFRNSNPFAYNYVIPDDNCQPQNDWFNDNDL